MLIIIGGYAENTIREENRCLLNSSEVEGDLRIETNTNTEVSQMSKEIY